MTLILNKSNRDHEHRKEKKFYIILEQKIRMYLCEAGFFVAHKHLAIEINDETTARIACFKLNEIRKIQQQKVLCTLVYE